MSNIYLRWLIATSCSIGTDCMVDNSYIYHKIISKNQTKFEDIFYWKEPMSLFLLYKLY